MNEVTNSDNQLITKENSPYKWGEMLTFLRVRFPETQNHFLSSFKEKI